MEGFLKRQASDWATNAEEDVEKEEGSLSRVWEARMVDIMAGKMTGSGLAGSERGVYG